MPKCPDTSALVLKCLTDTLAPVLKLFVLGPKCLDTSVISLDFNKSTKPYSFVYQIPGRKLNLAYINPLMSLRWRSSFVLKPDKNEFIAVISSLNIFRSLITLLLRKNFLKDLYRCFHNLLRS